MQLDFDLRTARTTRSLSQADLARQSGVSVRQIRALENGLTTDPHPDTIRRLRSSLHLDAPQILSLEAELASRATHFRNLAQALRVLRPSIGFIEMETAREPDGSLLYFPTAIHWPDTSQVFDDDICAAVDELFEPNSALQFRFLDPPGSALWLEVATSCALDSAQFAAIRQHLA